MAIPFLEMILPIPVAIRKLELDAQTTSEIAVGRDEDTLANPGMVGRATGDDVKRDDAVIAIDPGDAIIG